MNPKEWIRKSIPERIHALRNFTKARMTAARALRQIVGNRRKLRFTYCCELLSNSTNRVAICKRGRSSETNLSFQ